jgi:histidinol-phosphate phosphatase family protein
VNTSHAPACSQVVILAGGMGTRLSAATGGLPKALVPVCGRSVLERQLSLARENGVERALLLLGHGADQILDWVGVQPSLGLSIDWVVESEPLGNGGALIDALERLESRFLVFFADQLMDFDVRRFVSHHARAGNDVTVVVHPNDHPYDSDLLEVDDVGRVTCLHRPPHPVDCPLRNVVNAATYVLERRSLEAVATCAPRLVDLARDLLPRMIASGVRIGAYRSREYLKDMGTPERLMKVEHDLTAGIVARRFSANPMPAILLDRDGTVNVEVGRITRPQDLELIPGIAGAVNIAHGAGYLVGVVTNQPVVARGDVSFAELDVIHARMEMLLAEQRAYVDGIYVCPHHPDRGFSGEVAELKGPCGCRKPATGLVDQAVAELNLDTSMSWLIGDTTSDVQCAVDAGLFPALVDTGHAGSDNRFSTRCALRFSDAPAAIRFIVETFPEIWQRCVEAAASASPGGRISVCGIDRDMARHGARLVAAALRRRSVPVVLRLDDGDDAVQAGDVAPSTSVEIVLDARPTSPTDPLLFVSSSPSVP